MRQAGLAWRCGLSLPAAALALLLAAFPLSAQGLDGFAESDEPLEVTAKDGIEWYREEKIYIARATRGPSAARPKSLPTF